MKKKWFSIIVAILALTFLPVFAWALDVSPDNVSGAPGDSIVIPINISDVGSGLDVDAFGFTISFDSDVLTFVEADKTGTLSETFSLVSGQVVSPGQVKVNGALFGTPVNISADGVLLNLKFTVNTTYKGTNLTLTSFKDDISTATTTNATFTITGVTVTVVVTPASTTDIVAGQAQTLTAEVLVNGSHLDLSSGNDVSFTITTGNGTLGANSLDASNNVQVNYATAASPTETATITATENVTGNDNNVTATVTSVPGPLATLTVNPDTKTLTADETQQFTVTGVDVNGNAVTDIGTITWSGGTGIGTIGASTGLFDATTVGTGTVTATSSISNITDTSGTITVTAGALAILTVSPDTATLTADDTQQFTATGKDADGNTASVGTITWSGGTGIGTINATGGLFDATTVGTGAVTATSSLGKSDNSGTITVTPGAAASLVLVSDKSKVPSGGKGTAVLTATFKDQDGNTITTDTGTSVTFTVTGTDTSNAGWTTNNANTASGVATIDLTTTGTVADPSGSTTVNIQAAGGGLISNLLPLDIVNFSATPDYAALVTSGTPHQALITAVGATNYTWSKTSGDGTLVDNGDGTATYTAPASITEGTAGHDAVIHVVDADSTDVTFDLTIKTYEPVQITDPVEIVGLTNAVGNTALGSPATYTLTVTGGSGAYTFTSSGAGFTVDGNGVLNALAGTVGSYTATAADGNYGDASVDNGFRAVSPEIKVVAPIAINAGATTKFESAGSAYSYTATGGSNSGTYVWTSSNASAGKIDSSTGVFTPATVASGSESTTIRATDPTFGTIYDEVANVTVYAGLSLGTPSNYVAADPTTYPLLAGSGATYTVTVSGGTGTYNWYVKDASGTQVASSLGAANTYNVDADTLFGNGAGVYTVLAKDATKTDFTSAELKVAVPMRITPMIGTHKDNESVAFTVTGNAGPFTWTVTNEAGTLIANPDFGAYTGTNGVANTFGFTPITEITTFRAQAQSADLTLTNAGLDKVLTGSHVIKPVVSFKVQVNGSDTGSGISVSTVTAVHDQTITAADDGTGLVTINGMENTGVTYEFIAEAIGYLPAVFSVSDLTAAKTVTLEKIATPGSIGGTVTPAGADIRVKAIKADGSYITNVSGESIETIANATSGAYTLTFDTATAGSGPYTVVASRTGYVTNIDDGEGVVGATLDTAGNNIALNKVTKITITSAVVGTSLTYSITASPNPFTYTSTENEIKVYEGTDDKGTDISAGLNFSAGTYTYTVTAPSAGQSASIFVKADTTTAGRNAGSGYWAEKGYTYVPGLTAPTEKTITEGGPSVASTSGETEVVLPAGGLAEIVPNMKAKISEVDATTAGADKITGSGIVEVTLINSDNDEDIGSTIKKIWLTMKFDPAKVPVGSLEAGTMVIYHAVDMAAMLAGNATAVPSEQIQRPIDYAAGKVTFWVDHLSAFGIGGAGGGGASAASGSGSNNCFIATAAYGSPFEAHVKILRKFRDVYLLTNRIGQDFVDAYYRYSPKAAAFIAGHDTLRAMVRTALLPLVGMSYMMLHMGLFWSMVMFAAMLMLMMLGIVRIKRGKTG